MSSEVLTLQEVAAFLKLHPRTTHRLLQAGEIPGKKVGGRWRIARAHLEEYLRGDRPDGGKPSGRP